MNDVTFEVELNDDGTYNLKTEYSLSCGSVSLGDVISVIVDRLVFERSEMDAKTVENNQESDVSR